MVQRQIEYAPPAPCAGRFASLLKESYLACTMHLILKPVTFLFFSWAVLLGCASDPALDPEIGDRRSGQSVATEEDGANTEDVALIDDASEGSDKELEEQEKPSQEAWEVILVNKGKLTKKVQELLRSEEILWVPEGIDQEIYRALNGFNIPSEECLQWIIDHWYWMTPPKHQDIGATPDQLRAFMQAGSIEGRQMIAWIIYADQNVPYRITTWSKDKNGQLGPGNLTQLIPFIGERYPR